MYAQYKIIERQSENTVSPDAGMSFLFYLFYFYHCIVSLH